MYPMAFPADAFGYIPGHMSNVDVVRATYTQLDYKDEEMIEDCWDCTPVDHQSLSAPWIGDTIFELIRQAPPGL